jgi:IS30 family transposase
MNKVHLLLREREAIAFGLRAGKGVRKIARELGRDHAVVSRELERNKGPDGTYDPYQAEKFTRERENTSNRRRNQKDQGIMNYVAEKLNEDWSPEQVAGRIETDLPGCSICPETIYRYIYHKDNRHLKLWINLRRSKPRRMEYHGRKPQREIIPNRVFIDQRPKEIESRQQIGHWESDNMLGRRESCGASATTERKSRFLVLGKLDALTAESKKNSLVNSLGKWPPWIRRTITFDNGSENAKHEAISVATNARTYFCYPYHPYEKGTVENTIGLVRQYLPKKESLRNVTQANLNWIAARINDRPRKCLGFRTPAEVFYEELDGAFGFRM